jgi:hypothetical protein
MANAGPGVPSLTYCDGPVCLFFTNDKLRREVQCWSRVKPTLSLVCATGLAKFKPNWDCSQRLKQRGRLGMAWHREITKQAFQK